MTIASYILYYSLVSSLKEKGWLKEIEELKKIKPDLSDQYTNVSITPEDTFINQKTRQQHVFQIHLARKAIQLFKKDNSKSPLIIDIGDSAGTHYLYLQNILKNENISFDWLSVNLDPVAVEKTLKRGIPSLKCRAEKLNTHGYSPDICLSFEMLEHLFNPIDFMHSMATESSSKYFCITVPYLKKSRVGLHHLRQNQNKKEVFAENVHIFELSADDWDLLFKFSGWKIVHSEKYLQYPKFGLGRITQPLWKKWDFEGFYGVILEKDDTHSKPYQNWS